MADATDTTTVTSRGRARISATDPSGTELAVSGPRSEHTVRIASRPDRERAEAVDRGVERILWQHLATSAGGAEGQVYAVSHRRPLRLRVSASTALGLLERGVPTIVREVGP